MYYRYKYKMKNKYFETNTGAYIQFTLDKFLDKTLKA